MDTHHDAPPRLIPAKRGRAWTTRHVANIGRTLSVACPEGPYRRVSLESTG